MTNWYTFYNNRLRRQVSSLAKGSSSDEQDVPLSDQVTFFTGRDKKSKGNRVIRKAKSFLTKDFGRS